MDYWVQRVYEGDLSVDFSEAGERCWRCGCKRKLQRRHIVPDYLGGKDKPSNFVLLCGRCHLENPNVADPEIMWDWLMAYNVSLYDTFWTFRGVQEYKRIYGVSLKEEVKKRGIQDSAFMTEAIKDAMEKASYHFGDPHFNAAAVAGIFRMSLKEYDREHGLKTEKEKARVFSFEDLFF